jgi:CubicO group peptidase (beta-lactamase class C family)
VHYAAQAPRPQPDLSPAAQAAAALPQLHSLVVSWRGEVVTVYHARGYNASRLVNIKSASKSIIAALVGIAIDRRQIPSVKEPIVTYFPELRQDKDKRKLAITVEDLLTMRSGLESTSGGNYGPWVRSRNWVRYALDRPLVSTPGTSMEYSSGTSHLLSAILTKATKMSTWQFAQQALARPLGFSLAQWPRDPQGIYFGGNEMVMSPRQMVALGEVYLIRDESARSKWYPNDGLPHRASRARRHAGILTATTATGGGPPRSAATTRASRGATVVSTFCSFGDSISSWSPPRRPMSATSVSATGGRCST